MHTLGVFVSVMFVLLWSVIVTPGAVAKGVSPPLSKMSTIIGHAVESMSGQEVGQITEVIIDSATGDVAYVVLASGGFLGLGEKLFAIPWHALQPQAGAKTFRLGMTDEQLKQAPSFDRDNWPDLEDKHWGDTIQAYYGQPPHSGQHLPPQTARDTIEQATQRLLRASHVLKGEVMNRQGQRLGEVEEVVIDTAAGTVAYTVLTAGGFLGMAEKLFAIPWRALRQSAGLGTFTLDVDKEALQKAPGFDKDHWPQQADTRWGG